jgi:quinol monooxygenase YgiN
MPSPSRWKSIISADSEREYFALLSFLPLKRYRAIPAFLRYTLQIERQLKESRGLLGYSLQAQLMSRRFWTLSVWEDEQAMMEFVYKLPHSEVIQKLAPEMAQTKFTRWQIHGDDLPPNWNEAKRRMAES